MPNFADAFPARFISRRRYAILRAATATALTLGAVLTIACGGSGGVSDDNQDTTAANQALGTAVLTLADFPDGWTSDPAAPDDGSDDLDLSERCQILNQNALPNEVASNDSDNFTGPEQQGVSSSVTVFRSGADAAAALNEITDSYDACEDELLPEFERQFHSGFEEGGEDEPAALADLSVDLEAVPFSTDADATASFRIRYGGTAVAVPFEGAVDFVIMQQSTLIAGLVFFAFEGRPDEAEEHQIADLQLAKLRTANESLPD